ncbi:MAG: type 1 glutamine amidotransferase [Candidatus Omnitrophica bacterium]|nr:type 1 glutamine amidotransferase [Candidatus Omnitrophota bacterium]
MRIHYLEHVPHEGLGYIRRWARTRNYAVTKTRLYAHDIFPALNDFDWLVIMGGPMNADEEYVYPWLAAEKEFIGRAINAGKIVLGICLGAQLIARVLGAAVKKNRTPEIGWFPITLTKGAADAVFFQGLPQVVPVLHWHGDTFAIPAAAMHLPRALARVSFIVFSILRFGYDKK